MKHYLLLLAIVPSLLFSQSTLLTTALIDQNNNGTLSGIYHMTGDIEVKSGKTITFNALYLDVQGNYKITVQPAGKLMITNSILSNYIVQANNQAVNVWKGIKVYGTNNGQYLGNNTWDPNAGKLFVVNSSIFHASVAIEVGDANNTNISNGYIWVKQNSDIVDCKIGILFHATSCGCTNMSRIENSYFLTTPAYKYWISQVGGWEQTYIKLNGTNGVRIRGNHFENYIDGSNTNRGIGVDATNSYFRLEKFGPILMNHNNASCPTHMGGKNVFVHLGTGVNIIDHLPIEVNKGILLKDIEFRGNQNGIQIMNSNLVKVYQNYFEVLNADLPFVGAPLVPKSAIYLINANKYDISENTILYDYKPRLGEPDNNLNSATINYLIWSSNSAQANARIFKNELIFKFVRFGSLANPVCKIAGCIGIYLENANNNVKIECNNISMGENAEINNTFMSSQCIKLFDIWIDNTDFNASYREQISPTISAGNRFTDFTNINHNNIKEAYNIVTPPAAAFANASLNYYYNLYEPKEIYPGSTYFNPIAIGLQYENQCADGDCLHFLDPTSSEFKKFKGPVNGGWMPWEIGGAGGEGGDDGDDLWYFEWEVETSQGLVGEKLQVSNKVEQPQINVFPVPVKHGLDLFIECQTTNISYEICEITGRRLKTGIVANGRISIPEELIGVYILQINSCNSINSSTHKIIVY